MRQTSEVIYVNCGSYCPKRLRRDTAFIIAPASMNDGLVDWGCSTLRRRDIPPSKRMGVPLQRRRRNDVNDVIAVVVQVP